MDATEFVKASAEMATYIGNYVDTIKDRNVVPKVKPGYMRQLVPDSAPAEPDEWKEVLADLERVVMPGLASWVSPRFHAYFATGPTYVSCIAEMLIGALGNIIINWNTSPAATELEVIVVDWLAKMLDLPEYFLHSSEGYGGGAIQASASESTLMCLLAAKSRAIRLVKENNPSMSDHEIAGKLISYTSNHSNSSVERCSLLGGVKMRLLETDENFRLRGGTLQEAIAEDRKQGLLPFFVTATLGTTTVCSFDCLDELGPVCQAENIWLHVDAAYAGSAFVCPEFRYLKEGMEFSDSITISPHKWMLTTNECTVMWVKDSTDLIGGYNVDRTYLKNGHKGPVPDFRHWGVALGKRFRALKLWFVLRMFGVKNIQMYIRKHVSLAHEFEALVKSDSRFEVVAEVICGLVCFRLKGPNHLTEELLSKICQRSVIFMVPASGDGIIFLRFAICSQSCTSEDIQFSWNEIRTCADMVLTGKEQTVFVNNRDH